MKASRVMPLLCAALLSGCVSWTAEPPALDVAMGPDPAQTLVPERLVPELRLVEAVERAERALASLARALPAPDPSSVLPRLDDLPASLRRPVTLDWRGPIEVLAAELARRAGYRFAEAGRPPVRPLIVAVEAEGEPLIAVLRDAGLRAGSAATLTVDAERRTVLLDWAAPQGDG